MINQNFHYLDLFGCYSSSEHLRGGMEHKLCLRDEDHYHFLDEIKCKKNDSMIFTSVFSHNIFAGLVLVDGQGKDGFFNLKPVKSMVLTELTPNDSDKVLQEIAVLPEKLLFFENSRKLISKSSNYTFGYNRMSKSDPFFNRVLISSKKYVYKFD